MQRGSVSLVINLVGLREAVFHILGYEGNKEGKDILYKVIDTAVSVAKKKGKETGDTVNVCMVESEGASRFATLDGEKYGKMSILKTIEGESYSEGIAFDAGDISGFSAKSDKIVECNRMAKMLDGGLLTRIKFSKDAKADEIKNIIEKASDLLSSFKPVKKVAICGNCGLKDEKLGDKCPKCKSPYIIN
jgi:ribonucleoside-triphosphate reductase